MTDFKAQIAKDIKDFEKYDGDKNGEITFEEAVEYFKKSSKYPERSAFYLFKALDKNRDGKISASEIRESVLENYKDKIEDQVELDVLAYLRKFDRNDDEKIEFNEMVKHLDILGSPNPTKNAEFIFSELDTNNDKVITYKELEDYSRKVYSLDPSQ